MARSHRRRRKNTFESSNEGGMERWLITYADLITLLLIFFILMYSMSKVDLEKYTAVANSLSIVLTGQPISIFDGQGPSIVDGLSGQLLPDGPATVPGNEGQLDEVKKQIEDFIKSERLDSTAAGSLAPGSSTVLGDYIVIMEQERGLVISFKDALLFPSGSDILTPFAQEIIRTVGYTLKDVSNFIRVEGHTDNLPINTTFFPSNWELSVLRATNVVHVLQNDVGIEPERLSIIGYGEYRPLVPNDSTINRAINRRVDIVILKQKYDYFEPPVIEDI